MSEPTTDIRHRSPPDPLTTVIALGAMAVLFLAGATSNPFVDPDVWHEMALTREWVRTGVLPRTDVFAYTPIVSPTVHHEWGTGAILYAVYERLGLDGLGALRLALAGMLAVLAVAAARRRGASWAVLCPLLPLGAILSWIAFSPVRAQVFTLVMLAAQFLFTEFDRQGRRWWILPWLALYALWVNLHAGFVVGGILFGAYTLEQVIRRRPFAHLVATGVAMGGLIFVNPYGPSYISYLWHAIRMDRPEIPEWASILSAWPPAIALYFFTLLLIVYAVARLGPRRLPGLLLVLLTAFAAFKHQRHLSLYAVAWVCFVPAWLQATPFGTVLGELVTRRPRVTRGAYLVLGLACAVMLAVQRPWRLEVPARAGEHYLLYPVGAVDHLEQTGFEGNLMTSYTVGAYVSWRLYPRVHVSLDGRYEVAYPPGALEESLVFYNAKPGWEAELERHPTDAVLVPRSMPVADVMEQADGWERVYADGAYEVWRRKVEMGKSRKVETSE